jgi:hypothetical protein
MSDAHTPILGHCAKCPFLTLLDLSLFFFLTVLGFELRVVSARQVGAVTPEPRCQPMDLLSLLKQGEASGVWQLS